MIFIIDLILCENYYYFRVSVAGCDVRIWIKILHMNSQRKREKKPYKRWKDQSIHTKLHLWISLGWRRKKKNQCAFNYVHLIVRMNTFCCRVWLLRPVTWNRAQFVHVAILKWQMICFYAGLWAHSLQCPTLLKMERPKFNCGLVPCDK